MSGAIRDNAWAETCLEHFGTTSQYLILRVDLAVRPSWIRWDMARDRHAATARTLQSLGQPLSMDGLAADNLLGRLPVHGDVAAAMTASLDSHVMRSMLAAGFLPVLLFTNLIYLPDNGVQKLSSGRWTPHSLNTSNRPTHPTEIYCIGLKCYLKRADNDLFIPFPDCAAIPIGRVNTPPPPACCGTA
ncbi:hypothetical protein JKP88DRAFT_275848 [Tribonema minus]|uniref:Uncharacterized protein n=1 Tax=Tribonema minus TaxID=303371 RepID=A0A836CLM2_9STRA|nr:hypothetical protein JKP88DRAFT_275848 [Tribonema minus]